MKLVRCAIYTRKSSDEGLEQSFNSLDAQREACAAYILSQASEGWSEVPELYDDGGLSGGTLERPALKRLLADIEARRVDIIVVYKVDRLTRSLLDFARLVEAFDRAGVSFVSITQSFNTTTSMGRLTLNMLLSFAQFEREVTAERIRDKIAASKARGMWMGGVPPLGYKPDGRTLAIVEEHAAVVRDIYRRYLAIGNVRLLADQLIFDGIVAPERTLTSGKVIGGGPFSRGQLYLILKTPTYLGEIAHKEHVYPGLHPPIIDRDTWDAVRAMLAEHIQGSRKRVRAAQPSLLAGKVIDEAGKPLVSVHACKGRVRYRYYVSRALQHGESETGMRIPAREIEAAVAERLAQMFDDPLALSAEPWLDATMSELTRLQHKATMAAVTLRLGNHNLIAELLDTVRVGRDAIEIHCHTEAVAEILETEIVAVAPATITLIADVRLTRSGRAMKLIQGNGIAARAEPDSSTIRLLAQAHRYWRTLRSQPLNLTELAASEGVTPSYLTRVLRLAFLSPRLTEALLVGRQRSGVDGVRLIASGPVPALWHEQEAAFLPG